eukprot:1977636-Pleurochrysis_carterae.AAC.1
MQPVMGQLKYSGTSLPAKYTSTEADIVGQKGVGQSRMRYAAQSLTGIYHTEGHTEQTGAT